MTTVLKLAGKVSAFKNKLKFWVQRVSKMVLDMFQTLAGTLKDSEREQEAFSDLVNNHVCVLLQDSSPIFQVRKTLELQRNVSVIHLFLNQVNRPYPYNKKISC